MLPTPNAKSLRDITRGDRLLLLCLDHGKDGKKAADLMRMALRRNTGMGCDRLGNRGR